MINPFQHMPIHGRFVLFVCVPFVLSSRRDVHGRFVLFVYVPFVLSSRRDGSYHAFPSHTYLIKGARVRKRAKYSEDSYLQEFVSIITAISCFDKG